MTTEAKTDLATVPKGMEDMMTLDRPTGADAGILGNEGIGRNDIAMPRIGLAQKMSPEIDPTSPRVVPGLTFTGLFHSLTKQVLPQPLHFVILRRDDPRWIEWIPRDEGGGIRDKDVRANDPRTKFGPDGEKPIATEYHDFIVLMLTGLDAGDPLDSIVALSLKSSGIKAAKHLNFLISLRGPKLICKGVYTLTTGHETDKKTQGVYATYKFANAGWLKPDSAIETLVVELFDAWKDRKVEIERVADDVDSFDPAKIEAEM